MFSAIEDAVVRTGSAVHDQAESLDTIEQESALRERSARSVSEILKLEEICAKLRNRVNELEKAALESQRLREAMKAKCEELGKVKHRGSGVSCGVNCRPVQYEQSVETEAGCMQCAQKDERMKALQSQADRSLRSAKEAERLGDQVSKLLEERDTLKRELKRVKSSQKNPSSEPPSANNTDERVKRIDEQWNRRLEALRAEHESVRDDYEKTILSLTEARNRRSSIPASFTPPSVTVVASPPKVDSRENEVLRGRVRELETRIESVKQYYALKLKKQTVNNEQHPPNRNPNTYRSVKRYPGASIASILGSSSTTDFSECPPLPERDATVSEWIDLLRHCLHARNREDLATELIEADYRKLSLVDKRTFLRALGRNINRNVAQTLTDIYAFGEDQIDYKTFLSDLATRCGLYSVDLEVENSILRKHVEVLMKELNDRIESVETECAADTKASGRNSHSLLRKPNAEFKQELAHTIKIGSIRA